VTRQPVLLVCCLFHDTLSICDFVLSKWTMLNSDLHRMRFGRDLFKVLSLHLGRGTEENTRKL
jgi:hypothetical protein